MVDLGCTTKASSQFNLNVPVCSAINATHCTTSLLDPVLHGTSLHAEFGDWAELQGESRATIIAIKMAPLPLLVFLSSAHQLSKRGNWASHEAGVIVVFCIVFIVATGLISLRISRCLAKRRAAREDR
ncbi:hypothetical protein BJ878DRAFT_477122 [Calycina marina]|uniref:Uncharacterized protein n=1 Tax=Calycina marina TaxID=1763456 RepID=A0A9P7Z9C3_9HELO|nr:hypothetical protein BJ878DRAFT_477122 [Calycina marina]